MEVIQVVFDQLQADIQQKLKVLEKQIIFILSQNQASASATATAPNEDFLKIRRTMDVLSSRLESLDSRLRSLESGPAPCSVLPTPILPTSSAGLEGLIMKPIVLPSPALTARSENQVVVPIFQRQIVLPEQEEVEPDEEAVRGVIAEQVGGIDEEEEEEEEETAVEEEEQEEEAVEEEEEETVELEEFIWKGKTYFKTPEHMVYRANEEGDVEDEPFARYDPKTNTLKRM
jgi:hypothetical protein